MLGILTVAETGEIQVRSDDSEAFVTTSTQTATASACLNLEEVSWRGSWSEEVRTRSRKRSMSRELYLVLPYGMTLCCFIFYPYWTILFSFSIVKNGHEDKPRKVVVFMVKNTEGQASDVPGRMCMKNIIKISPGGSLSWIWTLSWI